jgi:hypothetical protein
MKNLLLPFLLSLTLNSSAICTLIDDDGVLYRQHIPKTNSKI